MQAALTQRVQGRRPAGAAQCHIGKRDTHAAQCHVAMPPLIVAASRQLGQRLCQLCLPLLWLQLVQLALALPRQQRGRLQAHLGRHSGRAAAQHRQGHAPGGDVTPKGCEPGVRLCAHGRPGGGCRQQTRATHKVVHCGGGGR